MFLTKRCHQHFKWQALGLGLVDQFTYLGSNISSTEIYLAKVWNVFDRLSIIWKSNPSDKIKWDFFQAVAASILLYGCTTETLTKRIEKKAWWELHKNNAWYFEQTLEETTLKIAAWRPFTSDLTKHSNKTNICGALPKKQSDVLLWTPIYWCASVERTAKTQCAAKKIRSD